MFNSGYRNRRASDGTGIVNSQLNYIQTRTPNPAITGWTISGSDDTALNPAGGQTVLVNGSGFASGISATLNGIQIGAVTLVSPTQLSFTAPANSGGSYTLVVYNANGGAAILVPGLTYSSIPTYSTAAGSIGSYYETTAVSTSVTATSDSALTYTLASGSLPSGATLFGNGVITGTSPVESGSTTYTFAITATDAELQDVTRTFTLTINTDVVTWSSPDDGTTYTNSVDTAISNVSLSASSAAGYTVSYAANTLPTGVTLSNNTISGTPTVVQSVTTQLTATSATTNRSATRTINWVITILGDVYFKNTTMLLSANNSVTTSSFITDNSLNNALITPVGDSRAQNFNPYQFGYYSYQFNGSTDYLSTSRTGGWLTSGGNFTLEFWGYLTAYSALYVSAYFSCPFGTSGASNGWEHGFTGTATSYTGYSFNFKGGTPLTASYNFSLNVWYHIAVVKNGSTTAIYINGVSSATTTSFSTWTDNAALNIGQLGVSSYNFWFPGYLSNIRIVNGVAMYTGNFTPSTTPLVAVPGTILLTAQSNRFSDNSPNNYTLTVNSAPKTNTATPFTTVYQAGTQYYGVYFDGTGDYLSATLTAQAPGTGNFTYECWFYTSSLSSSRSIMNTRSGDTTDGFDLSITTNGAIGATYTNTGLFTSSSGVVVINTWYHIAVVRTAGTTITVYLNGTSLGNFTAGGSTNFTSTTLYIGAGALAGVPMLGYISNFRYTKGQALYTTTFTPATSPLTTTSQGATAGNVIILTCQSPTITDNSSNAFAVTANGDAKPMAQSPFTQYTSYTSTEVTTWGSGYFDGTGDYLTIPSSTGLTIGTNSATVEFWIYPTSVSGFQRLVTSTNGAFNTGSFVIRFNNGTFLAGAGGNNVNSSTVPAINQWSHIAWVGVSGSTQRLYINGISVGTSTTYNLTEAIQYIGGYYTTGPAEYANGYMSDVRVIKGTALYTSAFTPSFTAPLTAVTNTQLLTLQTRGAHNNSTFADGSGFNTLITRAGNVSNGTFSPYGNNFSNYFGTTSDYLSVPIASFPYSGTTWTIEGWFNLGTVSGTVGFFCSPDLLECKYSGTTFSVIYRNNPASATWTTVSGTITMATGTWYHIAISVSAGSMRLFINGVQYGSTTSVAAGAWGGTSPNAVWIGVNDVYTFGSVDQTLNGYVSNFRITNTAVYTSSFTPATTPLTAITGTSLLTCQGNRFIDTSLVNNTITKNGSVSVQKFSPFGTVTLPTYYSNYFDGSSKLSIANSSAFDFGTGNFTVEFWMYTTNWTGGGGAIIGKKSGDGANGWQIYRDGNNTSKIDARLGLQNNFFTTSTPTNGVWQHWALIRSGTNVYWFLNGVLDASTTSSVNITDTASLNIAYADTWGVYGTLSLSNVRIVKGQALYTSNFTPSTAPLTTTGQGATAGNVSLLTCQSSTLIDNSTNYFAITATGDVKPLAVSPFTQTASSVLPYSAATFGGSMYFDGTGDYLSCTTPNIGTNSFTVECWIYSTSTTQQTIFNLNDSANLGYGAVRPQILTDQTIQWLLGPGSSWGIAVTSGSITLNTWNHITITRNGSSVYFFINGVQTGGTQTYSSSLSAGGTTYLGFNAGTAYPFVGYISDFRFINGAALYTANFVPGTSPATQTYTIGSTTYSSSLLLNGTAGGVIDASRTVNLETVADTKPVQFSPYSGSYYSNYFDGAGDYLTTTLTGQTLGSGDFTIEFWMFQQINETHIFTYGTAWGDTTGVQMIYYSGSTNYCVTVGNANNNYFGNILRDQWVHVAIVRSSGTVKVYFNGVASATTLSTTTNLTATALNIGYAGTGNWASYAGYISNFRMVAGTAVYTTNFTPPTAPITAISGTRLLTCQSNMLVDNSANAFTITRTGDVAVKTQNPFAVNSGTSYYFDGTGDYLTLPENTGLWYFGSGDFTIECWIYLGATNASTGYIIARSQHGVGSDWYVGLTSTNQLQFYALTGGAGNIATSTGTLVLNTWTHVAVTRSGTNVRLFINGIVDGTLSAYAGVLTASYGPTVISNASNNTGSHYITGYITDLRVTKGYARYTATFTPSTTPLFLK